MLYWDLHCHSTNSDGVKTPAVRISQIQLLDPNNLYPWALTDHDWYSQNFVEPARELGIKAIWATEISAHSRELDCSFHVICYSPTLSMLIKNHIDAVLIWKTAKVWEQIIKLQWNRFDINELDFFTWIKLNWFREISVSNAHLAQYLFSKSRKQSSVRILDDLTWGKVRTIDVFIRECLQDGGLYPNIWNVLVPQYEPELSDLIQIAKKDDIVLSLAHPNFSFNKLYKKAEINSDPMACTQYFHDIILPILLGMDMKNFEINAKAKPEQVQYLIDLVKRTGGMNTFGSDNHGSDKANNKHGIFWQQNPLLTREIAKPITDKLLSFV
jgi:hypothetical protein